MSGPIKISQMEVATSLFGTEKVPVVQNGANFTMTLDFIFGLLRPKTEPFTGVGPYVVTSDITIRFLLGCFVNGAFVDASNFSFGGKTITVTTTIPGLTASSVVVPLFI